MRQLFFVREKNTNTWCTSSKHTMFYYDFIAAAIFLSEDNAKKAIREMTQGLDPKKVSGPCTWRAGTEDGADRTYTPLPDRTNEYTGLLVPDFEVVPFDLTPVCK
jgi:hypothetical protein